MPAERRVWPPCGPRSAIRARGAVASALLIALLLLASACAEEDRGAPATPSPPPAPGAEEPPPATAPAPEEAPPGKALELPAAFPQDVAVYPGASLNEVHAPDDAEIFTSFTTSDSLDEVEAFYLDRFRQSGWTVRNPKPHNPEERAVFADKGTRTATVILFGSPEDRRIDVYLLEIE